MLKNYKNLFSYIKFRHILYIETKLPFYNPKNTLSSHPKEFNMTNKKFKGQLEEFSYALGLSIANNLIQSRVKKVDTTIFADAMKDVFTAKEAKLSSEEANAILKKFLEEQQSSETGKNAEEGIKFLAENLKDKEVAETASGLQYKILKQGTGKKPSLNDKVKCHYEGTLIDGTVFDSSIKRNEPAVFPVNGVIKGWVEALQMMETGSKWRLFIPSELAYGKSGAGNDIGPDATLIFDVELLEIM